MVPQASSSRRGFAFPTQRNNKKITGSSEAEARFLLKGALEANQDLTREEAMRILREHGFDHLTGRPFQQRIWPKARISAGLPELAPGGRKKTKNRRSS
jgi:hypothetical protein